MNDEQHSPELHDQPAEAPADLQGLAAEAASLRNTINEIEAELKRLKERYTGVTEKILKTLDLMELDSMRAHGYLFFKETKTSVTTPKTIEDKKALFAFLEQRGIHDEMVSVNSQTLNSLYKSLAEDAAKQGILDFKMPGVGEPTSYTTLKLRKG